MEPDQAAADSRPDGRTYDELRPVSMTAGVAPSALGSVLIEVGQTRVICGVSMDSKVPPWKRIQKIPGGWLTAEYSMLPYSTRDRTRREVTRGKPEGRTQEIQRLIGRSLRAVVDLERLGERTLWVDCDVLQADGGTRTASVTGAYAALRIAVDRLLEAGTLTEDPLREPVAAVSVGVVNGRATLDLCYEEDVAAEVDLNLVMTRSGGVVEVQGTAETRPFSLEMTQELLHLGRQGIDALVQAQERLRPAGA